jgi:hypothetical protein
MLGDNGSWKQVFGSSSLASLNQGKEVEQLLGTKVSPFIKLLAF